MLVAVAGLLGDAVGCLLSFCLGAALFVEAGVLIALAFGPSIGVGRACFLGVFASAEIVFGFFWMLRLGERIRGIGRRVRHIADLLGPPSEADLLADACVEVLIGQLRMVEGPIGEVIDRLGSQDVEVELMRLIRGLKHLARNNANEIQREALEAIGWYLETLLRTPATRETIDRAIAGGVRPRQVALKLLAR